MLSDLKTLGDWYLNEMKQERGWDFDEIRLEGDIEAELTKANPSYKVFNYSAKENISSGNHAFIPSQYFMYVLKVKPLVILFRKYLSVLDSVRKVMSPEDLYKIISGESQPALQEEFDAAIKYLDSFSQSNFTKFVKSDDYRLGTKEIINKPKEESKKKVHTYRGSLDIQKSLVLRVLPVANESTKALIPLLDAILKNTALLDALEDRYLHNIPYIFTSKSGDDLLFKVMSTLGWMNKMEAIVEHIQITPGSDIYPWDNISDAFLLSDNHESKANANYSDFPVHYSQSLKKYIFIRNDLINTQAAREEVNTLLNQAGTGMSVTELTEGGSTTYLYAYSQRKTSAKLLTGGRNEIIYGAPGTGKSHSIKLEIDSENAAEITTVFHADTQYSDFVGSLKPTEKNEDGRTQITYKFRPGPFTDAYVKAVNHPSEKVYLVIEEINRAPAAAVFGEIFQLLDRSETGESSYSIKPADPDMLSYIASETGEKCTKLKLPANLFLSATMNSSDQAVMPMDTAFKRRWSFRYMKIDFAAPGVPDAEITLFLDEHGSEKQGNYTISWKDFAEKVINHMLKEFGVAEDRLIGPFFLTSEELENTETAREALRGKLFPYIWDDVLRHMPNERARLFGDVQTYGDLYARFEQEQSVFSEEVAELIRDHGKRKDSGQDESA